jgi:MFS family permease
MTEQQAGFELTDTQRHRSMNFAILIASCTAVAESASAGNILTLVSLKLGAQELFIGALSFFALAPSLFGVFTMAAIERMGKRRVLVLWHSIASIFFIPFLLLPVLNRYWSAKACLAVILIAVLLKSISNALATTGWLPLLQDIIPKDITGRFFAKLGTCWQSAGLVTIAFASWLLGKQPDWWKFQLLFGIALVGYIARAASITQMSERPPLPHRTSRRSIISRVIDFLGERELRFLMLYICFYMFAAMVCEPFKIKMLKDLGYSDGFILAVTVMLNLGAIISLHFWGRLADRFGSRAIFGISHIGMIVSTFMWVMVGKSAFDSILVFILYIFYSIFHNGNGIAQTRYILHAVPSNKQNYINIINMATIFSWAVAPLLGGLFLTFTKNHSFHSSAATPENYRILFITAAALFIIPHLLRRKLELKKDTPTMHVIAFVTRPLRNLFGPFVNTGGTKDSEE